MSDVVVGSRVVIDRGNRTAVAASDFTIPDGSITAIIGPNGSGKSTLLHAIAGLLPISEGSLHVFGKDPRASREKISYVLQYTAAPTGTPLTVRETVGMGRYPGVGLLRRFTRTDRERITSALERLGITDLERRHLTELSGGQRQRVYVAQGIAQDHAMLLLDEPLTGLDLTSAKTIDAIIHEEPTRGCTVVLTTHDLEEARAADHVILTAGRVIACGPPATVLTTANLATAYGLGTLHEVDMQAPLFPTEHHDHHGHDH